MASRSLTGTLHPDIKRFLFFFFSSHKHASPLSKLLYNCVHFLYRPIDKRSRKLNTTKDKKEHNEVFLSYFWFLTIQTLSFFPSISLCLFWYISCIWKLPSVEGRSSQTAGLNTQGFSFKGRNWYLFSIPEMPGNGCVKTCWILQIHGFPQNQSIVSQLVECTWKVFPKVLLCLNV